MPTLNSFPARHCATPSRRFASLLASLLLGQLPCLLALFLLLAQPHPAQSQPAQSHPAQSRPEAVLEVYAASNDPVAASMPLSNSRFDPWLGQQWRRLAADPAHPAGPAHWVEVPGEAPAPITPTHASAVATPAPPAVADPSHATDAAPLVLPPPTPPVAIRAGQSLIVEQDTPTLTARFRAVALVPAAIGGRLRVRLRPAAGAASTAGPVIEVLLITPELASWPSEFSAPAQLALRPTDAPVGTVARPPSASRP